MSSECRRAEQRKMGACTSGCAAGNCPSLWQSAGWARASFTSANTSSSNSTQAGCQSATEAQYAVAGTSITDPLADGATLVLPPVAILGSSPAEREPVSLLAEVPAPPGP